VLAYTLDWHRREAKSAWWEKFRLADLPGDDLLNERCALAGLSFVAVVGGTAKAPIHRYRFPPQEVELRGGESLHAVGGAKFGSVADISLEDRTVDIKKRMDTAGVHPEAVFAHDVVSTEVMADALLRIGEYVASHGVARRPRLVVVSGSRDDPTPDLFAAAEKEEKSESYQAARDVLMRRRPQLSGQPLRRPGETPVEAAMRIAPLLAEGVLAIQGPPGAGKTFTGSRMICELVKAGKRVGITANSHKVIRNLLNEVVKAAPAAGVEVRCIQKVSDEDRENVPGIDLSKSNEDVLGAIGHSHQVAAGTAWLWSREDAFEKVDVLFVDEAAQMSLANVLAVSQACRTLVLLGDPQQLEQPMQGSHP
jgi:uncharacterized protein